MVSSSPPKPPARRPGPLEQHGLLGLFAAAASGVLLLLLFCFLYMDYGGGEGVGSVSSAASGGGNGGWTVGRKEEESLGGECDLFDGEWVWDEEYPLYDSKDCGFVDEGFRCMENGRPDGLYTKWRWRPKMCSLPRFDAKDMLEKLRNQRLVFVGDSIGRNQWESLLCMLSSVIANKSSIYEVNGSPITKHNGFLVFKFEDYNCTVEYYRSTFLVAVGRAPAGLPDNIKTTIRLDLMDWMSSRWIDADLLIFNSGHWWTYEKTIRGGCYFQEGEEVKTEMSIESAFQRSIETLFDWIDKEVDTSRTQVIFRTYAPVHFRGGDWKTGGNCHLETLPELGSLQVSLKAWENFLYPFRNATGHPELDILNVTEMTARRRDGHSSLYYLGPLGPAPLRKQDCSHWCLPGVPDVWNELLYALFLRSRRRQESAVPPNATEFG